VALIRKSEAKRRKAAAARREEERVLRAEQALRRTAEREAERKERIAGDIGRHALFASNRMCNVWHVVFLFFRANSVPLIVLLLQPTRPAKRKKKPPELRSSKVLQRHKPKQPPCDEMSRKRRQFQKLRCRSFRKNCLRGKRSDIW
jgi:Flp pilus assembly protein TadB